MALEKIFDSNLLDFIRSSQDTMAFKSDHWTFIHIPKTAGSSFREEIANVRQPDYNLEVDYGSLRPGQIDEHFEEMKHQAIRRYCQNYFSRTRFVSGHFLYRDIARYRNFQSSKIISMLRDPLARLKSDFLHQTSTNHPQFEAARKRYPTFRHFIEEPGNQNLMYDHLRRDEADSYETTLVFVRQRYTWIGLQEAYNFSLKMLFMLFGMRIEPRVRLREGDADSKNALITTPADEQAAQDRNATDYKLYQSFHDRYLTLKKDFYQLSDYDRFFKRVGGMPQ